MEFLVGTPHIAADRMRWAAEPSLPDTRFLLEQLLLQPTMSNLLSNVRIHLPPCDASRLCPLARGLAVRDSRLTAPALRFLPRRIRLFSTFACAALACRSLLHRMGKKGQRPGGKSPHRWHRSNFGKGQVPEFPPNFKPDEILADYSPGQGFL